MTGSRAAFNNAGIVAGDNHGGTVVTTPRASYFVAYPRNAFAGRVAHRRAFDHNAAVTCFIANQNEWSTQTELPLDCIP